MLYPLSYEDVRLVRFELTSAWFEAKCSIR